MVLTPEIIEAARRSVLCWLATVDAQGQPNVSPKEIFAPFDDTHLVIAHIASPTSVRNLGVQPRVCVSFVDIFTQKGFKLRGTARVVGAADPEFARWSAPLTALAGPRFAVRAAIVIQVAVAEPILAPSYLLFPQQTSEASQVQAAMRSYGVRPAQPALDTSR